MIVFSELIFAGFWVCHTDLSGGGGEIATAAFSPTPSSHLPPTLISLYSTHLSGPWADLPTDLWAI